MKIRSATIFRNILNRILQFLYKKYSAKSRSYIYKNLNIKIYPGVFPPRFFHSTQLLLSYLSDRDLKNKTLLELGAGSGLLSLVAAKKGAHVTASDINPEAVRNSRHNAESNNLSIKTIRSDLFKDIPHQHFDWIIINPPFYAHEPKTDSDYAWFCGKNFEYFKGLFNSLQEYIDENSRVVMVLSNTAPDAEIKEIAGQHHFEFKLIFTKKYLLETCSVYIIAKTVKAPVT